MVVPGTIFVEYGFNSVGPIDGDSVSAATAPRKSRRERLPVS